MRYDIVITGTIGGWDCLSTGYVRYLLDQKKDKDVHVAFCSLGGYVMDGLVMNQLFKDHGKVHAHAFGMNASISTIAMLGCASIDIVKGSFFLIHNTSTLIMEYSQANKEQLDDYIKKITEQRNDLATFDDVLAQMYADKTGKSKEECANQMKKGNWMTAEQAVEFGLVDHLREDKDDEKKASDYKAMFLNAYKNNLIKEAGVPPLPSDNSAYADVADENGNPTPTFLQKALQGVKNLLHNNSNAEEKTKNMSKKTFSVMAALLGSELAVNDKNEYVLSEEQAEKIEDRLAELNKSNKDSKEAINAAVPAIDKLKAKIADLEKENKQKDEQIENLQKVPGEKTNEAPESENKGFTADELWDCIKNV